VTLRLTTAGESHGPALVGILTGLPAGLSLDRAKLDYDLRRRHEGYGRSPRQRLEHDEVEVLAGLRHGRTLGTPLAFLVRNLDHENWAWGMSPWPPETEPTGKGTQPVTLPRPGHGDLAGALKFGLADVRDALERASARQTAVTVAAGAIARALVHTIGISVESTVLEVGGAGEESEIREAIDAARDDRDTLGGVVEARARGVPPGLGSYATQEERLDARLAAALMGTQAVKAVEIGAGLELARSRGSQAHDEILGDDRGLYRETNRAGGIEAGVSNGEEIVVRAAMKPLPTLMRPLRSVDLESGEPGEALVERSDTAAVEALSVVAEASMAFELARAAREKFGGDSLGDFLAAHRAYLERIPWQPR
jgi:chorismate synthase